MKHAVGKMKSYFFCFTWQFKLNKYSFRQNIFSLDEAKNVGIAGLSRGFLTKCDGKR